MFATRLGNNIFKKRATLNRTILNTLSTSIQSVEKNVEDQSYDKQLKQFETLKNITKKPRIKKPQRPPFVKNLLLGEFDMEIVTYPQLEKEDLAALDDSVAPLKKLLQQSHMVKVNSLSNKAFRQNLADYRAIGLQASQFMDGRELNVSESAKFLETLSQHKLGDNILCNEQLGVQTLIQFADDKLKNKYLYPIIKGEKLSAFCVTEPSLADFKTFSSKAVLTADKKTWILNGKKAWVVNGFSADYFIVFAITDVISRDVIKEKMITAFLVEKDFGGITCDKKDTDTEVADVTFQDTPVPCENVIGTLHHADEIVKSIITNFRLSCGPPCITLTKNMINNLTNLIAEQSDENNLLYKTDAVRSKIGEICTNLYAMESITYLTTGLLDWYEKQDCDIESAIVKVFCSEKAYETSNLCLDLIGVPSVEVSHWAQQMHKKCLNFMTLFESNDSLKVFIALAGLEFAGKEISGTISKIRNPLFHAGFIWKRMWTNRRHLEDRPKLDLGIEWHLHPSLLCSARYLEYCVKRLQFATELILTKHGIDVVNKHIELKRLAETIIDTYALTACLGRASRSYCIGLQNSEYEIVTATAFSLNAKERVQKNVMQILAGDHQTNDENYRALAKRMFKWKEYFLKHPLSRNF